MAGPMIEVKCKGDVRASIALRVHNGGGKLWALTHFVEVSTEHAQKLHDAVRSALNSTKAKVAKEIDDNKQIPHIAGITIEAAPDWQIEVKTWRQSKRALVTLDKSTRDKIKKAVTEIADDLVAI